MRLFSLLILVFFASFLSFKGKKYIYSQLVFLLAGLVLGFFVKGLEKDVYTFFELSLLGFFGLLYGMSVDVFKVIKTSPESVKKGVIEVLAGMILILVLFAVFHARLLLRERLAITAFILVGASPYFFKDVSRDVIVASFLIPGIVALVAGFWHFSLLKFFILMIVLPVLAYIIRLSFYMNGDFIMSLSTVVGAAVIVPYIAIKYHESPFFYTFLLGIFVNILTGGRIVDFIYKLKDEEKMFFLVFLFLVGMFTRITFIAAFYGFIVYLIKVMFKAGITKFLYGGKGLFYYISQGAPGLVIMIDLLGPGKLLTGVGAILIMAYLFNLLVIAGVYFRERY